MLPLPTTAALSVCVSITNVAVSARLRVITSGRPIEAAVVSPLQPAK